MNCRGENENLRFQTQLDKA